MIMTIRNRLWPHSKLPFCVASLVAKSSQILPCVGLLIIGLIFSGCSGGSISNTNVIMKGPVLEPYNGQVQVFWKEHGAPNPNSYVLIATASGRSFWCGVEKAKFNTELHQWIINQAGRHGGNAVILYCGEIGSIGECSCYGDIIFLGEK